MKLNLSPLIKSSIYTITLTTSLCLAQNSLGVGELLANASSWANMRKSAGSVRAESENLLMQAEQKLKASGCKKATILFTSSPNKRLADSSDGSCSILKQQTSAKPFIYSGLAFATMEEFSSWFGSFSQGKGTEGNDLYKRCPGDCSPSYKNEIKVTTSGGYQVTASAECGLPRDKDDNKFQLKASILCQDS